MDALDLYKRGTEWAAGKIPGAVGKMESGTPCDEWNVRALLNHMLDSQQWFTGAARGESTTPGPAPDPPDLIGEHPAEAYEHGRQAALEAFADPEVQKEKGMLLGIGFVDQLVHGWDLAIATGQDATIPDDLASAAFKMIEGRMDDSDQRKGRFKAEVKVSDSASAPEKLLAYTGRDVDGS
jgi:uncharacterized protein (TIGR03086 family)